MDFDEYDYLEKTVENPETPKAEKRDRGDNNRSSSHRRSDEKEDVRESRSRKVGREGENGDKRRDYDEHDKHREHDRGSSRPHDKDRHRSSREDHERRSRDVDREHRADRERDRGERNGRDRVDRDKEKDRTRERKRDGEVERERERDVERSRRSSSRSAKPPSDRDREHEIELERRRSRDREARERESESQLRDRESRRFKEKKEAAEPEADPERDQRTVFAYQMPLKANEKDVYEFFSKAGKVRDVRLIMDRNSRRSKGVGYIEFYDAMSVPMAIALSGQLLLGQPVMVKPSEAEKNLVQSTSTTGGSGALAGQYSAVARKLYVGNLHFNMTEDQLRQVFEPFGPVELVQLPLDLETGQCKGFGFVQFAQLEHAKAAQSLNGKLDIAGRLIKVSAVTDHVGVQETGANAGDFDDEDGGGLSLNARSRAMLMQKLDRTGIATSIAGSLGAPMLNGPTPNQLGPVLPMHGQPIVPASALPTMAVASPIVEFIGAPSECLLIKNMFDPNEETEPDFDLDIKEEVQEECSNFGPVKHIYVDKNSAGHVYLRFDAVASAVSAQHAMHGRWFARRLISATFMLPHEYEAKFRGGV